MIAARPVGLAHSPQGASAPYNRLVEPPSLALPLSAFGSFAEAVAAARAKGAGLLIDQHFVVGDEDLAQPNVALYGRQEGKLIYGGRRLRPDTPCLMYAVDGDIVARGVLFEGFGDVFGGCAGSVDRGEGPYAYQTPGAYGFVRCVPKGVRIGDLAGVGLALDLARYPRRLGVTGPGFDVSDCVFVDCERVIHLQSDSLHFGEVRLDRVVCRGTYGVVDQNCTVIADTFAFNLDYGACVGARAQPSNNCHGMHTALKLGVDKSPDWKVRPVTIRIENCRFSDVADSSRRHGNNCNSAVGVDIRNALAANLKDSHQPDQASCDIYIGYNQFMRMRGAWGNEDCNAIYAKCFGLVVEGNHIVDCGSTDARANGGGDGSEATGVLLKDPFGGYEQASGLGVFVAVRHNRFETMPSNPSAKTGPLYVIKLSDMAPIEAYVVGNTIEKTDNIVPGGDFGLICAYGPFGRLEITDNRAIDCALAPGRFIALKSFKSPSALRALVARNNVEGKGRVGARPGASQGLDLIYVDGSAPTLEANYRLTGQEKRPLTVKAARGAI